ncbi:hypothetical protein [Zoogloea sp. LCSB751]|uniref:hypothetical protein n=1 Tax=Zoogloea sp. LCSB751 TaxID=1965277 RepID=UPI000B49695F|nr:hypothetical protein [Zoogloea sp. LCSB751]
MYLSPSDIQQTRLATLDNLHAASRAWVEATEKLAELTLRNGRQLFEEGRSHLEELASRSEIKLDTLPVERLSDWRADSASLVREYFAIIGDAHQSILQLARDQVAVLDQAVNRQLEHAARSADANGEAAIGHVKKALRQAEAGFNELADAAARGADLVEEQVRQVSEALSSDDADDNVASGETAVAPRSRRRSSAE